MIQGKNIPESTLKETPDYPFELFTEPGDPLWSNKIVKHNNRVWYASRSDGLSMTEGLEVINFNYLDSTISDNLNDICFDKRGNIIFGSNEGEIYIARLDSKSLIIDYYLDNSDGLEGSTIDWMVPDKNGFLWAGTNLGLNCINLNYLIQ